jgi:hypothetical protein
MRAGARAHLTGQINWVRDYEDNDSGPTRAPRSDAS